MSDSRLILMLNRQPRNQMLLAQFLKQKGYQTRGATSYAEFADAIASLPHPHLALVDITGFDPQIWRYCERLQHQHIPFLILSAQQSSVLQQASLSYRASGVLIKPLLQEALLHIMQGLLET